MSWGVGGRVVTLLLLAVLWPATAPSARGQMVTGGVGLHGASSRFYERNGVSFGFGMGGSGRVRCVGGMGSPLGLLPFGGLGGWSNGGLRSGWSVRRGGTSAHFGFYAYQGSHRSLVSSAAVVTGLPGYPMSITDVVRVPFVVGVVPIGWYGGYMVTPVGGFWSVPADGGLLGNRSWRDPWWHAQAGGGWPDRSYPVVEPRETLADRFRAARRRAASRPPSPRRSSPRPAASATSVRDLSSAAFRQLGGRVSRR